MITIVGDSFSSYLLRLSFKHHLPKTNAVRVVSLLPNPLSPLPIEVGIWKQGLDLIGVMDQGARESIVKEGVWCGDVEYRGMNGRDRIIGGRLEVGGGSAALAGDDQMAGNGLLFVDQRKMLDILRSAVGDEGPEIEYGVTTDTLMEGIEKKQGIFIDCGGLHSKLRPLIQPHPNCTIRPLGFNVTRGTSPHKLKNNVSFQCLGPDNKRFAAVPSSDGGCTWFSTTDDVTFWNGRGEACEIVNAPGTVVVGFSPALGYGLMGNAMSLSGDVRYTAVGDAARAINPILSQGITLAVEDAFTLGRELSKQPDEYHKALRSYERERMHRMIRLNVAGGLVKAIGMGGVWGGGIRDYVLGMIPEGKFKRAVFHTMMEFSLSPRVKL